MNILILFLVLFFIVLLILQVASSSIIEGLETQYQNYDTSNPSNVMILVQKNSGNIEYLKQKIDKLLSMESEIQDISGNVASLQSQINSIAQAQQQYAQQMAPSETPVITGT
jgi:TolA-binding protein